MYESCPAVPAKAATPICCEMSFCTAHWKTATRQKRSVRAEKKISDCSACDCCMQSGNICAKRDDRGELLQKMIDADVIVLARAPFTFTLPKAYKT